MADPTTKSELLAVMHEGRSRWEGVISEVGDERMTLPGVEGDWSVKDISRLWCHIVPGCYNGLL